MQNIINSIGEENIYIVIAIIVVIIIALLIIIIIEKVSAKKYEMNNFSYDNKKNNTISNKQNIIVEEERAVDNVIIEEKPSFVIKSEEQTITSKPIKPITKEEEIIYVTEEQTKEEAKKAIEEAAKKLVYEEKPEIVSPTFFEKVQEEESIISYDELMNTNIYEVIEEQKEIMDEGNEPITLDEIYSKDDKIELPFEDDEIEKEPIIKNNQDSMSVGYTNSSDKFKPSDVISPVFGVKREVVYEKEYNELGETINIKELEVEIKKTEEFLKELKKLKDKLD